MIEQTDLRTTLIFIFIDKNYTKKLNTNEKNLGNLQWYSLYKLKKINQPAIFYESDIFHIPYLADKIINDV